MATMIIIAVFAIALLGLSIALRDSWKAKQSSVINPVPLGVEAIGIGTDGAIETAISAKVEAAIAGSEAAINAINAITHHLP
jgi:hypothetical protein